MIFASCAFDLGSRVILNNFMPIYHVQNDQLAYIYTLRIYTLFVDIPYIFAINIFCVYFNQKPYILIKDTTCPCHFMRKGSDGGQNSPLAKDKRTKELIELISEEESKIVVMRIWMEVIGMLLRLEEREDELLAEIGTLVVAFPIELVEALYPHLGSRIGVLRTNKEYLIIRLPEDKMQEDLCGNERALECCEVI